MKDNESSFTITFKKNLILIKIKKKLQELYGESEKWKILRFY